MMRPNPGQEEIIRKTEGIYAVDAGAGTGKTTALTQRYMRIIRNTDPDNVLLLTFTVNAAENMRRKILSSAHGPSSAKKLSEAPISTFHALCSSLLREQGFHAPAFLDIDEPLGREFGIIEHEAIESRRFSLFYSAFRHDHPEYDSFYRVIDTDTENILSCIHRICCRGIFPRKRGWFLDGEELLRGDMDGYSHFFTRRNRPGTGKRGPVQSRFLKSFKRKLRSNVYSSPVSEDGSTVPDKHGRSLAVEKDHGVHPALAEHAFYEDREQLFAFIHDIYYEYITFCLKDDRINFSFMLMLAFVLLYHNHSLRAGTAFDYVMVDEFQDTNEIQFMLTLLLMKKPNLCAVGDWKQGIYGFRHATIDNILEFPEKIKHYADILNRDTERIPFPVDTECLEFDINYRSSQTILDFSEKTLLAPGRSGEKPDPEIRSSITHLEAARSLGRNTVIGFITDTEDECGSVLGLVQHIIGNSSFPIIEESEDGACVKREPGPGDIAVLTRTRKFGRELQEAADSLSVPVSFDGGIELFRTEPAVCLLAWLRIMNDLHSKKGWITVLESEGYPYSSVKHITETREYPRHLAEFRKSLVQKQYSLPEAVDRILMFHSAEEGCARALASEIDRLFSSSLISLPSLVRFMEDSITGCAVYETDTGTTDRSVTIQTIHGAKGLEYPIVIMANVNTGVFPAGGGGARGPMVYHPLTGLRITREFGTVRGYSLPFRKWQTDFLTTGLFSDYDEERRLLYVASTRAKQYLFFTGSDPSPFFRALSDGREYRCPETSESAKPPEPVPKQPAESIEIQEYTTTPRSVSVHDLMEYTHPEQGRGKEFGNRMHWFAHRSALGLEAVWDAPEAELITGFLNSLKTDSYTIMPEIECLLPVGSTVIRGIIDLLAVSEETALIVDYKSDLTRINENEYIKQLSVYAHAVQEYYPGLNIRAMLYYVCLDSRIEISSLVPLQQILPLHSRP